MTTPLKIIVTKAHMEFPMCPAVYSGTTDDGKTIRARYRWGRLTVRLDPGNPTLGGAADVWILDQQLDPEGIDGCMSYDEIRELTAELIDWPSELTPKTDGDASPDDLTTL